MRAASTRCEDAFGILMRGEAECRGYSDMAGIVDSIAIPGNFGVSATRDSIHAAVRVSKRGFTAIMVSCTLFNSFP